MSSSETVTKPVDTSDIDTSKERKERRRIRPGVAIGLGGAAVALVVGVVVGVNAANHAPSQQIDISEPVVPPVDNAGGDEVVDDAPDNPESNNVLTDEQIESVIVKLWGSDIPFDTEQFYTVMHSLDSNDASYIYGGALNNSVDIDSIEVILMNNGLEFADWYPAG